MFTCISVCCVCWSAMAGLKDWGLQCFSWRFVPYWVFVSLTLSSLSAVKLFGCSAAAQVKTSRETKGQYLSVNMAFSVGVMSAMYLTKGITGKKKKQNKTKKTHKNGHKFFPWYDILTRYNITFSSDILERLTYSKIQQQYSGCYVTLSHFSITAVILMRVLYYSNIWCSQQRGLVQLSKVFTLISTRVQPLADTLYGYK